MGFLEWLSHETSLHSLLTHGTRDIYIILLSRFLRMYAYGGAALVLGIFLYTAGNNGPQIGAFMSMTLLGDAAISYVLTLVSDKIGRRLVLRIGSLLMTLAGTVFASTRNYYLLLFAAIFGVISPGAHEVGPFRAVEESTLAQLTPIEARTDVYAWFAVTSTIGMSLGLCVSGWITYVLRTYFEWDWKEGHMYPFIFAIYAVVGLVKFCLTFLLSDRCEANYDRQTEMDVAEREASAPLMGGGDRRTSYSTPRKVSETVRRIGGTVHTKLTPESRTILIKLCCLFALNSFASGMLPVTLMSWYANWRYRWFLTNRVGYTMAAVWLVASIANLFSASVARRLGLVRAMVFTHLPTAIFLAFIPLASTWWLMAMLLLASSAFGSMDQAPRSAFVAAVFLPSERTAVMGTLNLVRTLAAAGGPLVTGYFHEKKMWTAVFFLSAVLKISYDIGLLVMFVNTKLPETQRRPRDTTVTDVDVGILLSESLTPPEAFESMDDEEDGGYGRGYGKDQGKWNYEHIEEL
ncbi:hypothetical protein LTR33_009327 [Friedmanniomyces endolithicus]|nr:hypothetical protein LTR94_017574 [Friedmanniomyces endolithicus]KAK0774795.1 hypothetical protein LTR59_014745 [Friedmanniomyces endolithicus]KAK0778929.1 hypothetical protein LTR38_014632 [Friedmanniomyces endolithicus]KAK1076007.1 hypothetical protein LTR33_009327 [Friedmanniomyces endolithicus]